MRAKVPENITTAVADHLVLRALSYLPSITQESGDADDNMLRNTLRAAVNKGLVNGSGPAGHEFLNTVATLSQYADASMSSEDVYHGLKDMLAEEPYIKDSLEHIAYKLASVAQMSYEGMATLSNIAESIVENVDNTARDLSFTVDPNESRQIKQIDLGAADDADIIGEALHFAEPYFTGNIRDSLLTANPSVFLHRGNTVKYKGTDRKLESHIHEACDKCTVECPRDDFVRFMVSPSFRSTLFPKAAINNKNVFLSSSIAVKALWNTVNNIINDAGDEAHDEVIKGAEELRTLVSISVLYHASILEKVFQDLLIFKYSDTTIFVSPVGYQKAENEFEGDLDETLRLFVTLKAVKNIEVPEKGWSITEVLHRKNDLQAAKQKLDEAGLKNVDDRRAKLEKQAIEDQLRAAVKNNRVELLNDRARQSFHKALKNDHELSNHVLDFLVHSTNHPALAAYHAATKEATRSNEDLSSIKGQGTFDALGNIFINCLVSK